MIKLSKLDLRSYDVIHGHNYPANNAAAIIKRKHRIPVIWVCNGVTGFHISPDKPEEIAYKLMLLIKDDERRIKMGKEAARHAMNYSWNRALEQIEKLYKAVKGA